MIAPILLSGLIALKASINQVSLRLLLAFSAAYLFSISIIHLLPEAFAATMSEPSFNNVKLTGLFIVLGFSLQLAMDTFSTGIEHGHVHLHSKECHDHLPFGIIIGLMLHSFLEGLPIYNLNALPLHSSPINHQLIYGLILHNIPISIAFVLLLKEHKTSRKNILFLLLGFSLMTPLGYLFSYSLQSFGLQNYHQYSQAAFAIVIGIFLHISTAILFETSEQHKYNVAKIIMMVSGIILAYIIS
ncbi:MAG: zinc/iron permease [Bacteroidetes bacterium]|nr:zinc/iron permease [Bacteroidota bacterium]